MENLCHFLSDRRHRYSLVHRWNPLLGDRLIMWIGLNPSTADEQQLDPTLTRIRGFSQREGFDGFLMTNLFGLRTPYPDEMMKDPVRSARRTIPRCSTRPRAARRSWWRGACAANSSRAPMRSCAFLPDASCGVLALHSSVNRATRSTSRPSSHSCVGCRPRPFKRFCDLHRACARNL